MMIAQAIKNNRQPLRKGLSRRKLDGPASQANQRVVVTEFDHAETCVLRAAIDAQDAHAGSLYEFSGGSQWAFSMDRVGNGTGPRDPSEMLLNNSAAAGPWRLRIPCGTRRRQHARTPIASMQEAVIRGLVENFAQRATPYSASVCLNLPQLLFAALRIAFCAMTSSLLLGRETCGHERRFF